MRHWRSRVISGITLAAFLVADGFALTRTLTPGCGCQACSESATPADLASSGQTVLACCNACELTTCAEESGLFVQNLTEDVFRPSCPCQDHERPVCPCPGGCGYCSVAKIPCTGQALDLIVSASPFQWSLLDSANCYSSPYNANHTRPPRA
jgi:hypothetical protein